MSSEAAGQLSDAQQRREFEQTGVVVLRSFLSDSEVSELKRAVDAAVASPTPLAHSFSEEGHASFHSDMYLSAWYDEFRSFSARSRLARVSAELLGSRQATLFADELLIKEPGASRPTPWHHDLTYWPVSGDQALSIWCALDRVVEANGRLTFVLGSHRWKERFSPRDFDTGKARRTAEGEQEVSIDEQSRDDIFSTDAEPGDCFVFHAKTLHHATGNVSSTHRRRAVVYRFAGDDIRWAPRPKTLPLIWAPNIGPGSELASDPLFPQLYSDD